MFTLVHAGNTYNTRGGLAVYVKMKKRHGGYRELQTPNGTYIALKDREIFVTRRGFREYGIPLFLEGYDFIVNCDIANSNSAVHSPGTMFINEKTALLFDKRLFLPRKMFLDSGGFLLLAGTAEFLDPIDLAHTYNNYANLGMTLDIPLGPAKTQNMERLIFQAHVQVLNTKIIKKHLDGSVTLYNISHGGNERFRSEYMDIVYDDDLDHWACAGSAGTPFDRLFHALLTADKAGRKKLKSMHILGVASSRFIPILAWLGRYIDVTSDASSAMKFASNYTICELNGIKLAHSYAGNKLQTDGLIRTKNFHPQPHCNCNVCHALGSTELYQKIGTYGASTAHTELLWMHNQYVYDEYTAGWNALAKACTPSAYKKEFSRVLSKQDLVLTKAIDFIEDWLESSASKVYKKYRPFMQNTIDSSLCNRGHPTNFSLASKEEEQGSHVSNILRACRNYYKYHGNKLAKYAKFLKK